MPGPLEELPVEQNNPILRINMRPQREIFAGKKD